MKANQNTPFIINGSPPNDIATGSFYYPELFDTLGTIKAKRFMTDELAIVYYKHEYGRRLQAVVRDRDPDIAAVYVAEKKED
jgi:hypothetical protein